MSQPAGAYAPCPPLLRGTGHDELLLVAQVPNHLEWICRSTNSDGSAFGWVAADFRGGRSPCRWQGCRLRSDGQGTAFSRTM